MLCRISDDGMGFDPELEQAGFGRLGMEERASRNGANLEFKSAPGQGTQVTVDVSLR